MGASRLRILGSLAIVVLHTMNAAEILFRGQISERAERLSMMPVYSLMWAVPVFVMVSGALLLDPSREITLGKIFKQYILRVFAALCFCVLIFRLFDTAMQGSGITPAVLLTALEQLFTGGSWSHLWYLYMLLGIYLLLPAYRLVAKCDEKTFRYLCIIGFVFLSVMPMLEFCGIHVEFHIQLSVVYTLYLFLGYGISSRKLIVSKEAGSLLLAAGSVLIFLLLLLYWRSGASSVKSMLSSYASPAVVLQSVGIFAWFWAGGEEDDGRNHDLLRKVDALTFGIYLFHMIPLRFAMRYKGWNPFLWSWRGFVILIAAALIFSALITALLRCIPGVKKML